MTTITYAKEVLEVEAKAILDLASKIDDTFTQAVQMILNCPGRVVVTGMGKSGLIGQKISATFASTGTPSLYLHPAEAIHGDVGRVLKEDLVIALSNGGETSEILQLYPILRKIGVQVIAVTGREESSMARLSNLVLTIGKMEEACYMGLAPTASTTAMLALGDALAMAVAKERNFTPEEYALFHPGGSLGRKLMKVSEIMRTGDAHPCVHESIPIHQALYAINKARAGAITVINDEKKICGIFTDGGLRRQIEEGKNITEVAIGSVMTKDPIQVSPETLVVDVLRILKERKIDEVPVVDENQVAVGMLDIQDLLEIGLI